MLQVHEISKKYGHVQALHQISFYLDDENCALLGPNGSGKTTLLRILAGLLEPTSGNFVCSSNNQNRENHIDRKKLMIGYLPQKFGVFPDLTVEEQLRYFACLKHKKGDGIDWNKQIRDCLSLVHMEEFSRKKCKSLSGGMVRRLGIAQAILGSPDLILLDEPTVGLDIEERMNLKEIVCKIRGKCPILLSTHIAEDVEDVCSKVMIISHGKKCFYGETHGLAAPTIQDGYLNVLKKGKDI